MKMPAFTIRYLHGQDKVSSLSSSSNSILVKGVAFILFITVVAAVIEAFVTPFVLRISGWG